LAEFGALSDAGPRRRGMAALVDLVARKPIQAATKRIDKSTARMSSARTRSTSSRISDAKSKSIPYDGGGILL
jgi:hypothetical protein